MSRSKHRPPTGHDLLRDRSERPERPDVVDRLCPGTCNRRYLTASRAAAAELQAAHDEHRDEDPAIVEHDVKPHAAQPVWCRTCQARILAAIGRLPELAAALFEHTSGMVDANVVQAVEFRRPIVAHGVTLDGQLLWLLDCGHTHPARLSSHVPVGLIACAECLTATHVGAGRLAPGARTDGPSSSGKRVVSPSGSVAWDAIDEIVTFAGDLEDRLRATLGHTATTSTYWTGSAVARARHLSTAVGYLTTWGTALLSTSYAEREGQRALQLEQRAERAAGLDRLVHRLPAPCPRCDRKALVRDDGSEQVDCRACGSSWPESDYRRLVLVLADEFRRTS